MDGTDRSDAALGLSLLLFLLMVESDSSHGAASWFNSKVSTWEESRGATAAAALDFHFLRSDDKTTLGSFLRYRKSQSPLYYDSGRCNNLLLLETNCWRRITLWNSQWPQHQLPSELVCMMLTMMMRYCRNPPPRIVALK